eukprot:g31161.t1
MPGEGWKPVPGLDVPDVPHQRGYRNTWLMIYCQTCGQEYMRAFLEANPDVTDCMRIGCGAPIYPLPTPVDAWGQPLS